MATTIVACSVVVIGLAVYRSTNRSEPPRSLKPREQLVQAGQLTNDNSRETQIHRPLPFDTDLAELEHEYSRLQSEIEDMRVELQHEATKRDNVESQLNRLKKTNSTRNSRDPAARYADNKTTLKAGYSDEFQPQDALFALLDLDGDQVEQLRVLGEDTLKHIQAMESRKAIPLAQTREILSYECRLSEGNMEDAKGRFVSHTRRIVGPKNLSGIQKMIDQVFEPLLNKRKITFTRLKMNHDIGTWSLHVETFDREGQTQISTAPTYFRPIGSNTIHRRTVPHTKDPFSRDTTDFPKEINDKGLCLFQAGTLE